MPLTQGRDIKNPWKKLIFPGVKRGEHEGIYPSLLV
jgi:hypothetical protein